MTPSPDLALTCARRLKVIPFFPRGDDALLEIAAVICERCTDDQRAEQTVTAFIHSRHGIAWPGVPAFSEFCAHFAGPSNPSDPEPPIASPGPAPVLYYGHLLDPDSVDDDATIEGIDRDADQRIAALKHSAYAELEQWATRQYNALRDRSEAQRRESERAAGPSPFPPPPWWTEPHRHNLINQIMRQQMLRHLETKLLRGEPLPPIQKRKEKE